MRSGFLSRKMAGVVAGLTLVFFIVGSCSQDDVEESVYKISFKAGGSVVEFNTQASLTAAFGQSGTQYVAVFSGFDATSNISLQVHDGKAIDPATFSGYTSTSSAFVGALIAYQDNTGTAYTQGLTNPATITISGISAEAVRGTFSGILKATGKADIVVTDGEFFVKRVN